VAPIVAWHFTDPGCPWAYSSRPAMARLRWRFGAQVEWRLVLIGLAESGRDYKERGYTTTRQAAGRRDFQRRFGMPFTTVVKRRLAGTSPGCRAVVAAREVDPALGYAALRALQLMQFTTPGLLDEPDDIRAALEPLAGLDATAIVAGLESPGVRAAYEDDRARARSATGTPTHVQGRHAETDGPIRYTAPSVVFEHPGGKTLEVGGFQPFESYDNALANLEPGLERRPAPSAVAAAVHEFPVGLTTAEIASIMRPTDLEDADLIATEHALMDAVAAGTVRGEPHGTDALWFPA
jgi:2-hydroxychromene-2-carboxylate isomerase